jgi:transposase
MAKPYSQDLRDRVIEAVERGKLSRRAAARHYEVSESVAIKWLERVERDGSREPVGHGGHRASKLMPHRDFLEADDEPVLSRIGVTVKKRPLSHASRIART